MADNLNSTPPKWQYNQMIIQQNRNPPKWQSTQMATRPISNPPKWQYIQIATQPICNPHKWQCKKKFSMQSAVLWDENNEKMYHKHDNNKKLLLHAAVVG